MEMTRGFVWLYMFCVSILLRAWNKVRVCIHVRQVSCERTVARFKRHYGILSIPARRGKIMARRTLNLVQCLALLQFMISFQPRLSC